MSARNEWKRWFPALDPDRPGWFRLIRFERVDAQGQPIGKPLVAMTPGNSTRRFHNEISAASAAAWLNREEGR